MGDAKATLGELSDHLSGWSTSGDYQMEYKALSQAWTEEVDRIYAIRHAPLPSQGEIIGIVNEMAHRMASWCALRVACRAIYISSGVPAIPSSTIWNMATALWAMKSLVD